MFVVIEDGTVLAVPCNARGHAGNNNPDVIGVVRIILRDSREDVRSARIKLHQVARNTVGLLLESLVNLIQSLDAVRKAFQFQNNMGAITKAVLRNVRVQLFFGLLLEAGQHDPVRLIARRVVDAIKVADDVRMLLDHPLLVLVG